MILPKELSEKPSIVVHYVIDGKDSQVFFSFDKILQMKTPEEVEAFFLVNKIEKLTEEFKQVLKTFLREL